MGTNAIQGVVAPASEVASRTIRILQAAHFANPLVNPNVFKAQRKAWALNGTTPAGSTLTDEQLQRLLILAALGLTIEGEQLDVDPSA